ncbi:hypothetical protein [Mycolicibacterium sp. HS_4_1]
MSEFPSEIPGQIAAIINRLGDGRYTHMSIYPLPVDAGIYDDVRPKEWIQATGVSPNRLTVEIKQRDAEGEHRLYTIGRPANVSVSAETESIQNGDNTYLVHLSEVLTATDAIALFQHYYDTHAVPEGWSLREQPEFSDSAVAALYRQRRNRRHHAAHPSRSHREKSSNTAEEQRSIEGRKGQGQP